MGILFQLLCDATIFSTVLAHGRRSGIVQINTYQARNMAVRKGLDTYLYVGERVYDKALQLTNRLSPTANQYLQNQHQQQSPFNQQQQNPFNRQQQQQNQQPQQQQPHQNNQHNDSNQQSRN